MFTSSLPYSALLSLNKNVGCNDLIIEILIVDINDNQHLCREILKERELLTKKYNLIVEKKLRKIYGIKPLKNNIILENGIKYNTPESKTHWNIFYRIYRNTTIEKTRFVSIHKHIENTKTYYIVLDSEQTGEVLLQIFNPHFVERLIQRLRLSLRSNEIEIADFILGEEFRNVVNWLDSKNETEHYQITKWGLSLGEYDKKERIFNNRTFLSKKELFEDQNNDLKKHFLKSIKKYDIDKYQTFIENWSEYLDPIEMLQTEMLNFNFGHEKEPAKDFFLNEVLKNWK